MAAAVVVVATVVAMSQASGTKRPFMVSVSTLSMPESAFDHRAHLLEFFPHKIQGMLFTVENPRCKLAKTLLRMHI